MSPNGVQARYIRINFAGYKFHFLSTPKCLPAGRQAFVVNSDMGLILCRDTYQSQESCTSL